MAMCFKILFGIPFFKQAEDIFILHATEKITSTAASFSPDGPDQGVNRLGQFLTLPRRHPHMNGDKNHASV
jgi:hypothetical protein